MLHMNQNLTNTNHTYNTNKNVFGKPKAETKLALVMLRRENVRGKDVNQQIVSPPSDYPSKNTQLDVSKHSTGCLKTSNWVGKKPVLRRCFLPEQKSPKNRKEYHLTFVVVYLNTNRTN